MGQGKCPERIVGYTINGLVCGLLGGVLFVGVSGISRGLKAEQTINSMRVVPYMAFQVGLVVGVYSTFDCLFKGIRGQDDRMNVMASGAATGALIDQHLSNAPLYKPQDKSRLQHDLSSN